MVKEDNIIVPRWFLEVVEDTLRIQNNINLDEDAGETCQDRNIRESLNGVRKLLNGEDLTGMERLEKLHPSLPSNLDEAANDYIFIHEHAPSTGNHPWIDAFKAGAEWMAEQGYLEECTVCRTPLNGPAGICMNLHECDGFKLGDRIIVQIRKKQ